MDYEDTPVNEEDVTKKEEIRTNFSKQKVVSRNSRRSSENRKRRH